MTQLFRDIATRIGRSEAAVSFKVRNVSSCDPRPRESKPIAEAAHAQRLLIDLFHDLWPVRDSLGGFLAIWGVIGHRFGFTAKTESDERCDPESV